MATRGVRSFLGTLPACSAGVVAFVVFAFCGAAHASDVDPIDADPTTVTPLWAQADPDDDRVSPQRTPSKARRPAARAPRPRPDARRPVPVRQEAPNAFVVGLAAAGGGGGAALAGTAAAGVASLYAIGLVTPDVPELVALAAGAVALGVVVATPFIAGLAACAAVLLLDSRSQPSEWQSLLTCAGTGYCMALQTAVGCVSGSLFCAPGLGVLPGADKPADWTAASAVAGMGVGAVVGLLVGWQVNPNPELPELLLVSLGAGALGGAVLGAALGGGTGATIATAIRR